MRVGQRLLIVVVTLLVAGCDSEDVLAPPAGYANAAAARSCGPADGPAVVIYLAADVIAALEPAVPYIRIDVWLSADDIVGTWALGPSSANVSAARFQTALGSMETATSGKVVLSSVGSDSTITGSVDLRFPSTGQVRGGFRARWISRTLLCG